ncbi:MAG: NADH-quinone oxidoreductase subunit N [Candidatus Entotheonella factor]|uniref:NADH-quinone oxidoreductase subunit N n=1 Tax=Entotheonella factor TaxID=1429438 RepID=W4LKX3_ENTF1|nr:MAG: NADH-quinone oxidoreductase subunit N [Candidatus Entotheonella factor]
MTQHVPVLIVVVPLLAAVLVPLVALWRMAWAQAITLLALIGVIACSSVALLRALATGPILYELGGWAPPWGIVYVLDPLSGGLALLVGIVAALVAVYTRPYLHNWSTSRAGVFLSLFLLLVTGLLGIVATGDLFNLYVFLEISSLAGYALLASGPIRSAVATFRYLIIGTIAATFYLLGVGYLYALTGSLNMADIATRLSDISHSGAFAVAITFIVLGLSIKAALFPLHGWLPDAYTYAPAPVIGFISAVMAKVSAYALFRVLYFVLRPTEPVSQVLTGLSWIAAIAILAGSLLAVAQRDVRRMLAYSSVSQMGYIFLGLALGTPTALKGALLHLLNHAIMKGCLFLAAGGVQWRTGGYRLEDFIGMSRRMPLTMAAIVLAAISMIGLPPTAGFFSKWYLIQSAIEAQAWVFVVVFIGSSLLSAIYFFRWIEWAYIREPAASAASEPSPARQELPVQMLVPIWTLATGVLLLGLFNQSVVNGIIQYAIQPEGS